VTVAVPPLELKLWVGITLPERNASTDMTCLGKDILSGGRLSPAPGYDDGCQVTEARLLRQNGANLLQMIHVVSGDLGGQVADRHLTALGVDAVSLPLFLREPREHTEIRSP
jgi:hypothetical protein